MSNQLGDLRASLDNIDNAIIYLLAERFRLTRKVGEYKRDNRLNPVDKDREAQQMQRVSELAERAELDPVFAQKLLRLIINEVVKDHKKP